METFYKMPVIVFLSRNSMSGCPEVFNQYIRDGYKYYASYDHRQFGRQGAVVMSYRKYRISPVSLFFPDPITLVFCPGV